MAVTEPLRGRRTEVREFAQVASSIAINDPITLGAKSLCRSHPLARSDVVGIEADALALGVYADGPLSAPARAVDAATGGLVGKLLSTKGIRRQAERTAGDRGPGRSESPAAAVGRTG